MSSILTENPLFLFVDDLVNGNQTNFASDGKIVELFDTGCDARTPGGTLKKTTETNVANGMTDVREPVKLSEPHDKNSVKKNPSPAATGLRANQSQNIGAVRKSLKQWNSTKDKLPFTKSNGFAIKPTPDPITAGKRNVAKGSVYSGRGNPAGKEPRANGTLTGSKIRSSTFGSRAKTSPTTRISEVAINHGLRKYVDRAVDKDSLSNCSKQLDAKISGQASRLPRSCVVSKVQPKETRIRNVGKTDLELLKSTTKTLIKTSEADTIPDSKASKADVGRRDAPIASKMTASRVPLSRFSSRNLSTTKSTVDKMTNEVMKVSKSSERLSSSAPDNKSSVIKRSPTYQEKVLARPSVKSHKLNPRESPARNSSTVSFQTKLPRPMTPLTVPNLVTELKLLHDNRKNEASRYLNASKFLDRVNVASTLKIPKSVSLSGIQGVDEKDEEIELKTIFEDTSADKSSADDKTRKVLEPPTGSKVPRPVMTKLFPVRDMGRISPSRTPIRKQESRTPRRPSKNTARKGAKKTSTPPTMKSVGNLPESESVSESLEIVEKPEVIIPIMNPEMCTAGSFAAQYRKKSIPEKTSPQEPVRGGKIEPWIDGHEQAYLKGRAIGLRVASLARAAEEKSKVEFVKTSPKNTTPMLTSRLDKSQEIVDIGVSVIEKVLAEKNSSIQRDRVPEYFNLDKNTKWNSRQWI